MTNEVKQFYDIVKMGNIEKTKEYAYKEGLDKICTATKMLAKENADLSTEEINLIFSLMRNMIAKEDHLYSILFKPSSKPYLMYAAPLMVGASPLFTTKEKAELFVANTERPELLEILDLVNDESQDGSNFDRKVALYKMLNTGAAGTLIDPGKEEFPVCIDLNQVLNAPCTMIPGETEKEQALTKMATFYFVLLQQQLITYHGRAFSNVYGAACNLAKEANFLLACTKNGDPYIFVSDEGMKSIFMFTNMDELSQVQQLPFHVDNNFIPLKINDILKMASKDISICLDPFSMEMFIDAEQAEDMIEGCMKN